MFGIGEGNVSYSGKSSYRYVERLIEKGRDILIISPYIDRHYAQFLISKSRRRRFHILCSSVNDDVLGMLEGRKRLAWLAVGILGILVVDILVLEISRVLGYLFFAFALFILIWFYYKKPSHITVKVPGSFVHAKMYLSEKEAIRGSANLTYPGMHSNVEHIEVIRDAEEVEGLRNEFWRIWRSA